MKLCPLDLADVAGKHDWSETLCIPLRPHWKPGLQPTAGSQLTPHGRSPHCPHLGHKVPRIATLSLGILLALNTCQVPSPRKEGIGYRRLAWDESAKNGRNQCHLQPTGILLEGTRRGKSGFQGNVFFAEGRGIFQKLCADA